MIAFADTGFYVALLNPRDRLHIAATSTSADYRGTILTTELVLIARIFHEHNPTKSRTHWHRMFCRKNGPRDAATVCVRQISYPRVPKALNRSISHRPAEHETRGGEKCGLGPFLEPAPDPSVAANGSAAPL